MAGGFPFIIAKATMFNTGAAVDAARMFFYQSGTTTKQNGYTTAALSVAHSNPLTADAYGKFAAVWLDPTLSPYKIVIAGAGGVLDDPPSNIIETYDAHDAAPLRSSAYSIEDESPYLDIVDTDATSGTRVVRVRIVDGQLRIALGNDAKSAFTDLLTVDRTNNTADAVNVVATALNLNGEPLFASGSFTGALSGFAADLTPTVQWRRSVDTVWLSINAGSSGTSTTTAMTLGTLPASIRPAVALTVPARLTDNGTNAWGVASIATSGVITFGVGGAGAAFTGSGTKGLPGGWSLSFDRLRA